ncbi:MAG: Holliday junction resolvase RuvX [Desulfovibrio sp.]
MRALAIDFGIKRVGLAVSDPMGILASPFKVIHRTTRDALFEEILQILVDEKIEVVVVGLPIDLQGEETLITRQARNFAESLERRTDLAVHMVDERLTSYAADTELKEAGLCGKKRKKVLDSQAAVHILRTWLECHLS